MNGFGVIVPRVSESFAFDLMDKNVGDGMPTYIPLLVENLCDVQLAMCVVSSTVVVQGEHGCR